MTGRKKKMSVGVAGLLLGAAMLFSNAGAQAQTIETYNPDPAHHSTDVNDPDPAHHRPILVCPTSAGGGACQLVAIPGFDLNGNRVGGGGSGDPDACPPINIDPAHHSTDLNDPDPVHHQPVPTCEDGVITLTPIPGFDLEGKRV